MLRDETQRHTETLLLHYYYYGVYSESHGSACTILLKKIPSGYLDYPMMHCISTGSNIVHDDNAPLHKAQVVTECFEWHDNNVSHMPMPPL